MNMPLEKLLQDEAPWVRWGALTWLEGRPAEDLQVRAAHTETLAHPLFEASLETALSWPGKPLTRHNQASHPLHAIGLVVGLGLHIRDLSGSKLADRILAHQDADGALLTQITIPKAFGGSGKPDWSWMACDAPLLLDALIGLGLGEDERVAKATNHLAGLMGTSGCRCQSSFPNMNGPGRKTDPCPYATLLTLRALSRGPRADSSATRTGTETLLDHWRKQKDVKLRMFGIGTDFRKLKYPYIWYDLLHVVEVLSRFEWVHADPAFREMLEILEGKADADGFYQPESVWMAWRGADFAQKRCPSGTLTLAAWRARRRASRDL